ncbi:MAG TPA: thioredoxin [Crocinitomix sp.]|nr:thioredoxin [Crocinitomix sp.]
MSKFGDLIKSKKLVLVDFHAEWCGPCKMLSPIVARVAKQIGDEVRVVKIDVDKNQSIAATLGIRGVPTLVLYKNGELVWRQSGVIQERDLLMVINQHK